MPCNRAEKEAEVPKLLKIPASDKDTFIVIGEYPDVSPASASAEDIIEFDTFGTCPDMTCTIVNGIKVCACGDRSQ